MKSISYFEEQFIAAVDYHRTNDPHVALEFIAALERAKDMISRFPKIGTQKSGYRYLPLKKFPYQVCYSDNLNGEVVLVTLFHYRQKEMRIALR
jgi:plasmid stabilization system protein ParE